VTLSDPYATFQGFKDRRSRAASLRQLSFLFCFGIMHGKISAGTPSSYAVILKILFFCHENGSADNSVKFCSTESHKLINEADALSITLSDDTKIN